MHLKSNICFASARDLVQRTSAHFASIPIIGNILRIPYYLLIAYFSLKLKAFSGVKTFYLKGSCARGDFYPGLSDLDLCVILNSEHTTREFLTLTEWFVHLKQSIFFQFFDVLGELEILTLDQISHPEFKRYSAFYSWKLMWGDDFLEFEQLSMQDQIVFARFKLASIPENTVYIKQPSYKRRLENVLRHTKIIWFYDETLSREENRRSLEAIIEHKSNEFGVKELSVDELEHFFLRFQWRNHFVNTFGRDIWGRETREALLRLALALLVDPLEQKKCLLWPAWKADSPAALYQELRARFL